MTEETQRQIIGAIANTISERIPHCKKIKIETDIAGHGPNRKICPVIMIDNKQAKFTDRIKIMYVEDHLQVLYGWTDKGKFELSDPDMLDKLISTLFKLIPKC